MTTSSPLVSSLSGKMLATSAPTSNSIAPTGLLVTFSQSFWHIDSVELFDDFRALKSSLFEYFRALKFMTQYENFRGLKSSFFDDFRALKYSNFDDFRALKYSFFDDFRPLNFS